MSASDKKLSPVRRKELQLPINRIKTIMKSSPDVETIGQEALYVVTKCTELFIQYMTLKGFSMGSNKDRLDYKSISDFTESEENLNFLTEILPRKMTVKECLALIKEYEADSPLDLSDDDVDSDDNDDISKSA